MKKITLSVAIFLTFIASSIGQINPVQNLTWEHVYITPNNFFTLSWDGPASPHDELIGYNVYREDELFIFLNGNSIYNLEEGSNCGGEDFFMYNNLNGFYAHVTAVYNPGPVESDYSETVWIDGPLLSTDDFETQKAIIYPIPSKGIINIGNKNLSNILIYDLSGKLVKELSPNAQIDLSAMAKGIYLMKLTSEEGILVEKIILE